MMFRCICGLFVACLMVPAAAQTGASQPKDAAGWFQRASEQMNLRVFGVASFHMKVTFHAFPGIQLLDEKKSEKEGGSEILAGDGVYEETWASTTEWRREVTLGPYHAIEVQFGRVRKMQADSDYEPSRVLMLLDALLDPIPHNILNPDLGDTRFSWKIDRHTGGKVPYVRISNNRFGGGCQFWLCVSAQRDAGNAQ
ncbi:MAG: hypothetical protein ABSE99_15105 [Terracidiphilus sp.]